MSAYPQQMVFNRATRRFQFLRVFIVIALGAGLFYFVSNGSLTLSDTLITILRVVGGFIALSGLIALIFLVVATLRDSRQVLEIDETGLTINREGKDKQALKWADVSEYRVEEGAGVVSVDTFMPGTNTRSYTDNDGVDDIFGCVFGLVFGLYFLFLEAFVGGWTRDVRFELKSRRTVKLSGSGQEMDTFIDQTLPHFLPDKRKLPGEKPAAKPKKTRKKEETESHDE